MRKGIIQTPLAIMSAIGLCLVVLVGCSSAGNNSSAVTTSVSEEESTSGVEAVPADEENGDLEEGASDSSDLPSPSVLQDESSDAPKGYFITYKENEYAVGATDGTYVLTELDSDLMSYPEILGRFKEGLAFAQWYSWDSYDEEWDEFTNYKGHIGCVDETGHIALDLTNLIPEEWFDWNYPPSMITDNIPYFENGYALVAFERIETQRVVCIDKQGNVVWQKEGDYFFDGLDDGVFEDGVVRIGKTFYNTAGDVVCSIEDDSHSDERFMNAGNGYYFAQGAGGIFDYSGAVVLADDFIPEGYESCRIDSAHYGMAVLDVQQDSPNGTGATRMLEGVWSLANNQWLVEPIADAQFAICGPELVAYYSEHSSNEPREYGYFNSEGTEISLSNEYIANEPMLQNARLRTPVSLDNGWYLLDGEDGAEAFVHITGATMDSYISAYGMNVAWE